MAKGQRKGWKVTVWDERSGFSDSRRGEFIFETYAVAREFGKRARKALDMTPDDTMPRYPTAGVDIESFPVYTTADRALAQAWPFDELQEA